MPLEIVSLNANGIRAAATKGFFDWMHSRKPDLVCIQETKAQIEQLKDRAFFPPGYHSYYADAERRGYSGVAIYSRHQPERVRYGLGRSDFDSEGRWIQVDFRDLSVISLYLPSGSSKEERQAFKYQIMDWMMPLLEEMAASGREYVICGDWNIAHREIDLRNWKSNQKNSGFLPDERAWMDRLFDGAGWVDAFRAVEPGPDHYTWWSNRGRAWDKNVGWRIDYHVTTPGIGAKARAVDIYKDTRFSDHAPLTLSYDWELA